MPASRQKKMPFFVSSKRCAKLRTILVHIFHDTNKRVTSLFFLRRMRQIIAKRKQEGGCGIHYHVIIFILLKGMYENVSIVLILPSTPILWHHTSYHLSHLLYPLRICISFSKVQPLILYNHDER